MSAQIDQRIFSNKCIDRPNGKLHDWGSFTQRTAAALVVYLLTVPIHAVPSFFACQNIFLNTRGVIGIEYWGDLTIWFLNLRIRIRNIFTKAVAKTHSFTKWEGPTFLNLDQIFNIGLSLNCKQRCCMYWDRPLTVLLLIPGPPTNCQF